MFDNVLVVRSVVITGVSRGLGAALFDEFMAAGDRILAIGRRFTAAQHAAERAQPARIRLRQCDLSTPSAIPAAAEIASFGYGSHEIVLINNAGVIDPIGAVGALPTDEIQRAVTVNLVAPMLLTNAVLATGVLRPGWGGTVTVVFVSSSGTRHHRGGWSVYGTTKRAVEGFAEAVAAQFANDPRVRIRVVQPGMIDTPMQQRLREYAAEPQVYFPDRDHFLAAHRDGELAQPAAVARSIIAEHVDRDPRPALTVARRGVNPPGSPAPTPPPPPYPYPPAPPPSHR